MSFAERSALCLLNWTMSDSMVDDGSYVNWLEGTRILEAAVKILPIGVSYVETGDGPADARSLSTLEVLDMLRRSGVGRVLIGGNVVERDIIPFALALIEADILPVILFDVCGTLDPIAKWRDLAAAVDEGVCVSTVQQTLRMLLSETRDRDLRARITAVMHDGLGEHAGELSAA